jgi:hypothetical protein
MNARKYIKSENNFSERRIKEKLVGQLFFRYAKKKKIVKKKKNKNVCYMLKKEMGFKFMKSVHKKTF